MTAEIKFGTDGWRAIIADDYTVENVKRVAEATARWMVKNGYNSVVIGHDCRFAGALFAETTVRVLGAFNIKSFLAEGFVSTPMVSLGVVQHQANLGIVITASHNPPSYNGFKLKSDKGGPMLPGHVAEVEALIPDECSIVLPEIADLKTNGLVVHSDLEGAYLDHVNKSFDLNTIRNSGLKIAYDAMYGAGQRAMLKILNPEKVVALHCENNPSFYGQAPEPIHKNLLELSTIIKNDKDIALGIANDGDADRIGMYDEDGNFVDSHHILLLLLLYLYKYKNLRGKVIITFSVTDKMKKMAEQFGLEVEVTKIGFKYIAEIMAKEDVLVGGEESGGLAVKGHIPERDGIWIGLTILEFMAKTGKSLKELIQEVYDEVGSFAFDRDDLHISEAQKQKVIEHCKSGAYSQFGAFPITKTESIDGYKFYFNADEWIMIRPSGTEPVLRVYAQSPTLAGARKLLDATNASILS